MTKTSTLTVSHMSATIQSGKEILRDVSLQFISSKVYAVMGPNGSGKSTFAHVCMGSPQYIVKGRLVLNGKNIEPLPTEERAQNGLFLSYQSPVAIPGVSVTDLLRTATRSSGNTKVPLADLMKQIRMYTKELHIDPALLERGIHDGFSGGERKKIELLQALILKPTFAIFDEIDTGLDVDALKVVANGINILKTNGTGVIMITHYKRLLSYVPADIVYVFSKGRVVARGNRRLVTSIEKKGYAGLE